MIIPDISDVQGSPSRANNVALNRLSALAIDITVDTEDPKLRGIFTKIRPRSIEPDNEPYDVFPVLVKVENVQRRDLCRALS